MDQATAIDKIRKCLNLAKCSTAAEAATAAYTAQKLIARYGIDETLLLSNPVDLPKENVITEQSVFGFDGPRITTWILNLATALAEVNNCKLWSCSGDRFGSHFKASIMAAGREDDLATISEMMAYLAQEIEEISKKAVKELREESGRHGSKTWTNSFKTGAVSEIRSRLYEARKQAIADARASAADVRDQVVSAENVAPVGETPVVKYELAVIDNAIEIWGNRKKRAEEWAEKKHNFYTSRARATSLHGDAWSRGRTAGAGISLNPGRRITG